MLKYSEAKELIKIAREHKIDKDKRKELYLLLTDNTDKKIIFEKLYVYTYEKVREFINKEILKDDNKVDTKKDIIEFYMLLSSIHSDLGELLDDIYHLKIYKDIMRRTVFIKLLTNIEILFNKKLQKTKTDMQRFRLQELKKFLKAQIQDVYIQSLRSCIK